MNPIISFAWFDGKFEKLLNYPKIGPWLEMIKIPVESPSSGVWNLNSSASDFYLFYFSGRTSDSVKQQTPCVLMVFARCDVSALARLPGSTSHLSPCLFGNKSEFTPDLLHQTLPPPRTLRSLWMLSAALTLLPWRRRARARRLPPKNWAKTCFACDLAYRDEALFIH